MKCSQTGRKIKAKFGDISKKDMTPMTEADLKGSSLVVTIHGKSYPVEFLQFVGMSLVFEWTFLHGQIASYYTGYVCAVDQIPISCTQNLITVQATKELP